MTKQYGDNHIYFQIKWTLKLPNAVVISSMFLSRICLISHCSMCHALDSSFHSSIAGHCSNRYVKVTQLCVTFPFSYQKFTHHIQQHSYLLLTISMHLHWRIVAKSILFHLKSSSLPALSPLRVYLKCQLCFYLSYILQSLSVY